VKAFRFPLKAVAVLGLLLAAALPASAATLSVVAAENFYGDIVSQIGGSRVSVVSIMSDPNVDPHEYESNVGDAKAVSTADLVIENSGGYDDWMDKLLGASTAPKRVVLKGFDLATKKIPDNEHVWYDPNNVGVIAGTILATLKKLDPAGSAEFDKNYQAFQASLGRVLTQIRQLKASKAGTPVGLTETIFQYPAQLIGLSILTPEEFQKAVAEGDDPPADSVVQAESQILSKKVKVLIYNEQTVTPATTKLQDDAKKAGIPVVPVTETMPVGSHYQKWMADQLDVLQKALSQ